jgi:glycogen debranching enzyme
VELALQWIDEYGDSDADQFVEYTRHSSKGLIHQGWKDSHDSVFHANGDSAEAAIALCEVQGYVFAARLAAATLAESLDMPEKATRLRRQAAELQSKFERAFWLEDLSTYALALDGEKRPCRVRASNAGQCLFSGIASEEHALRVARTMLEDDLFSGWGVRTVSSKEIRYNPMSYHNGSIWPHDNALIAYGLARYELKELAVRILASLFDATGYLELYRLPELFCGFHRRPSEGPTLYPVACSPQAWSVASVFLLIQSCLGLSVHANPPQLFFHYPKLPEFIEELKIENLHIGQSTVDVVLQRYQRDVAVNVLRRDGHVQIKIVK